MPFPESKRAIFIKNPLVEVICQLRFPRLLRLEAEKPVEFQEALRIDYPFTEVRNTLPPPPPGTHLSQEVAEQLLRHLPPLSYEFRSHDDAWKVGLNSNFIALTSYQYQRWEDFSERLSRLIDLLCRYYPIPVFTRLGLRYRDLIVRSTLGLEGRSWSELLRSEITGMLGSPFGKNAAESFSIFQCDLEIEEGKMLAQLGLAIEEDGKEYAYLIDSDYYIDAKVEVSHILNRLKDLNVRSGRFFRWCIKDELYHAMEPQEV